MFKDDIFHDESMAIISSDGDLNSDEKVFSGGFITGQFYGAKTKKARGVFFLQEQERKIIDIYGWRVPKHLLFAAGCEFKEDSFNFPVFIRPCPTVPKHGFVDSVVCNNADELNIVSSQTYKVEKTAELLVTKPVNSSFNAIINGGVITFAPGNDGATSGRGVQYFYINDDPLSKAINLDPNILLEGEVPFYEMVFSETGESRLVQVRSAPGVPRAKDFIPHRVEIKKVIQAEGNLIEWEEKMAGADNKTTVIDHFGGSLSSHYAIHSIINKIPIITTYRPNVGDIIEATVGNINIDDNDRRAFKESFIAGFNSAPFVYKNMNFKKSKDARPILLSILELSLATLHNFSGLSLSKDYELLGVVLGLFVRTTFSVSAGEARHSPKKEGFSNEYKYGKSIEKFFETCSHDREACYNTMFSKKTKRCIEDIKTIYYIFKDLAWGSSMGGAKWARCTESSIQLFNACVKGDIESTVVMFNRVINEEHNGGKYLNKLINVNEFDDAADNPSEYALRKLPQIIDVLDTARRYRVEKEAQWKKTVRFFTELSIDLLPPETLKVNDKPVETIAGAIKVSGKPSKKYYNKYKNIPGYIPNIKIIDGVKDVSVYSSKTLGQLDKVCVTMDDNKVYELKIPVIYFNPGSLFESCSYSLTSIPNWWSIGLIDSKQLKIISKASLTSKIKKLK
jgi:hypothetical protein